MTVPTGDSPARAGGLVSQQPGVYSPARLAVFVAALLLCAGCPGSNSSTLERNGPDAAASPAAAASVPQKPAPLETVKTPPGTFYAKPYLQYDGKGLMLLWLTKEADGKHSWSVEMRSVAQRAWVRTPQLPSIVRTVRVAGVPPHQVWRQGFPPLSGFGPGGVFDYRVLKNGQPVFAARARDPQAVTGTHRVVIVGDTGDGSATQKRVAHRIFQAKPDMVFITGDIVYSHGRASEYLPNFFSVYNADVAGTSTGVPLLRSTLLMAVVGNHDVSYSDLGRYPDGLAYFFYLSPPMNGPQATPGMPNTPRLRGPEAAKQAFLQSAGDAYPRIANHSFDFGNIHWTLIDSNYYMNWQDPALRAWLEKDLSSPAARKAKWRIVASHVPPFSSSKKHQEQQWMRVLCPTFEKYGVDMVVSGHVHNYQRTRPLGFSPVLGLNGTYVDARGQVKGQLSLDREFDGKTQTVANGVIYLISGAGGASLYDRKQHNQPETMEAFTAKFVSATHSFTVMDVAERRLTVRQIAIDGKEVDRFVVEK